MPYPYTQRSLRATPARPPGLPLAIGDTSLSRPVPQSTDSAIDIRSNENFEATQQVQDQTNNGSKLSPTAKEFPASSFASDIDKVKHLEEELYKTTLDRNLYQKRFYDEVGKLKKDNRTLQEEVNALKRLCTLLAGESTWIPVPAHQARIRELIERIELGEENRLRYRLANVQGLLEERDAEVGELRKQLRERDDEVRELREQLRGKNDNPEEKDQERNNIHLIRHVGHWSTAEQRLAAQLQD